VIGIFVAVVVTVVFVLLAGLVERGYLTRVWAWTSRTARGRRYSDE
jgi:hypothetical protein